MKQLITTLDANGKPINKDPAFWVKYYLENPSQLADFITIANDTARRLAVEVERLEAELAAVKAENERLQTIRAKLLTAVTEAAGELSQLHGGKRIDIETGQMTCGCDYCNIIDRLITVHACFSPGVNE